MGWTAATGSIALPGLIAFAVVFLWQLPHFMAISWIYREDYGRAGFAMLAVRDADGRATAGHAALHSFFLPPVGASGGWWAAAAAVVLLAMSIAFAAQRTPRNARRLFMTSNVYLLAAMALLAASCGHQSDLPRLFKVPNAALIDENARPVQLAANHGDVTVYDFIFTNCSGTCPMMTATMRRLTTKVDKGAKVRFVSISVDPERDT